MFKMIQILTYIATFGDIYVFCHLRRIGPLGAKRNISTLKSVICRKYSFGKLTQFSQGFNVLDAASSYIDNFVRTDTFVSSTHLNRPIWSNMSHNPP
jgi:hypothetical protein